MIQKENENQHSVASRSHSKRQPLSALLLFLLLTTSRSIWECEGLAGLFPAARWPCKDRKYPRPETLPEQIDGSKEERRKQIQTDILEEGTDVTWRRTGCQGEWQERVQDATWMPRDGWCRQTGQQVIAVLRMWFLQPVDGDSLSSPSHSGPVQGCLVCPSPWVEA